VAVLGIVDSLRRRPPGVTLTDGGRILLLGATEANLGGSRWAAACRGHRGGTLPALDLDLHRRLLEVVGGLVAGGVVAGLHDVGDGGLGVALAELALHASLGWHVAGIADHRELFAESPSRVVLCAAGEDQAATVVGRAGEAGIPVTELGRAGGDRLRIEGLLDLPLVDAVAAWQAAIPSALLP
jgi:phosphoribosylformylglycinamidine synthase